MLYVYRYVVLLIVYMMGIKKKNTFCFMTFVQPMDSIYHEDQMRKAMMHSNLVINLIGKEYESE